MDKSLFGLIHDFCWSPDGAWVVYSVQTSHRTSILRLYRVSDGHKSDTTTPVLRDFSPCFDEEGKYIFSCLPVPLILCGIL